MEFMTNGPRLILYDKINVVLNLRLNDLILEITFIVTRYIHCVANV